MAESIHPSRAGIAASQLEQLRSLVAELFPGNRFYTRKLTGAGVTFDLAGLADFSARFPFTTKAEIVQDQAATPPFGTNLTYPLARYTRYHQTSGTSGAPLRWLDTPESWESMLESWAEVFRAAGVQAGDRVLFAFSFGPFLGFWLAFEAASRLGCLCLPAGGLSSLARLRAILDNGVTVLCATPTYGIRLGEVAADENIPLAGSQVRRIIVAGEPGGSLPAVRARLAQLWPGARVIDHHGMTEVGPVTFECPARPGALHVIESAYFPEIIDLETAGPAAPGQTGELVLTTLRRSGSPLLRYRTGDLVQASRAGREPERRCACGRAELVLEGGILGRADDMVVVRGVNVYPSAVDEIVRRCEGVAEYRVELVTRQALPELTLQIEPRADCADASGLVRKLERDFQAALTLRVPIMLVPAGTLPRFEMKARRWVRR